MKFLQKLFSKGTDEHGGDASVSSEMTLVLFKPDAVEKNLVGESLRRYQEEGFIIRGIKMMELTPELLAEHYSHITDRPFYPRLIQFMTSAPVIALALEGPNVIARVREILGATDSTQADEGTIRKDYGINSMFNICHASDSPEAAEVELKRFFKEGEIYSFHSHDYLK